MTSTVSNYTDNVDTVADSHVNEARETKRSTKTTEFFAYLAAVVAIVVTSMVVGDEGNGTDPFGALDALHLITYLTIGYMLARGLAKSGSRTGRR